MKGYSAPNLHQDRTFMSMPSSLYSLQLYPFRLLGRGSGRWEGWWSNVCF